VTASYRQKSSKTNNVLLWVLEVCLQKSSVSSDWTLVKDPKCIMALIVSQFINAHIMLFMTVSNTS